MNLNLVIMACIMQMLIVVQADHALSPRLIPPYPTPSLTFRTPTHFHDSLPSSFNLALDVGMYCGKECEKKCGLYFKVREESYALCYAACFPPCAVKTNALWKENLSLDD